MTILSVLTALKRPSIHRFGSCCRKQGGGLLLLACATLLLTACEVQEPAAPEPPVQRPVKLFVVGSLGAGEQFEFPGVVSAVLRAELAFEVPGRIVELSVKEGQRVASGEVLARLDARDYEAEVASARANRSVANTDLDRYQRAFKANAVTPQVLDQARRSLEVADASLVRAQKALDDTRLVAPFAGRIARKLVEDYANVQAKQPVVILHSDDALEMEINVPESVWGREENGTRPANSPADLQLPGELHVVIGAQSDTPYPAIITGFSNAADRVTRTFQVTVGFEPPEEAVVSPGMTGHVVYRLPASAGSGLLVPQQAVIGGADGSPFVWLYEPEGGQVTRQPVTVGDLTGDLIRVTSGLQSGDRIAVAGMHSLSEGFPVRPMGG